MICVGGGISFMPNLKKCKVVVDITQRWGHCIIEEG